MPTQAEINAMIKKIKVEPKETIKAVKIRPKKGKPITNKEELEEALKILSGQVTKRVSRKDYGGNGHWAFPEQMAGTGKFGFIYVIRNLNTGRCYLGKKQYRSRGQATLGIESNWPWYTSSRDTLVEEIKVQGKENFEFIVIEEYCSDKGLGYAETWSLMFAETPSNQDKWYNRLVNKVNWFCKESITQRHKDRLMAVINGHTLTNTVSI